MLGYNFRSPGIAVQGLTEIIMGFLSQKIVDPAPALAKACGYGFHCQQHLVALSGMALIFPLLGGDIGSLVAVRELDGLGRRSG